MSLSAGEVVGGSNDQRIALQAEQLQALSELRCQWATVSFPSGAAGSNAEAFELALQDANHLGITLQVVLNPAAGNADAFIEATKVTAERLFEVFQAAAHRAGSAAHAPALIFDLAEECVSSIEEARALALTISRAASSARRIAPALELGLRLQAGAFANGVPGALNQEPPGSWAALVADLLLGRVDRSHFLYSRRLEQIFCADFLTISASEPGVDVAQTIVAASERCQLPMQVAVRSATGPATLALEVLTAAVADVRHARRAGLPVFAFFWESAMECGAHRISPLETGALFVATERDNGIAERKASILAAVYRRLIAHQPEALAWLDSARQQASFKNKNMENTQFSFPIIVHCHLRWDGVWQRPQQFLSRLSQRHRVLFVEGPTLVENNDTPTYQLRPVAEYPNVTVMQTFFPSSRFSDGDWVDSERLRLLQEATSGPLTGKFTDAVQWFYDPMAAPAFVHKIDEIAVVYDCMDELSKFKFAPPAIVERERYLLKNADVVFAGGRKMAESKSKHNTNCHFYGCGVDVKHFGTALLDTTEVPADVRDLKGPVLGYFGVIDERLDYDLLARLADAEEWNIVMIGPVVKVDPATLPQHPRIKWLGRREYEQLPAYVKGWDVCLMPFALNEHTEYINPTKACEYMATAKPIVSTAVPDVVSNFSSVVKVARDTEDFIELCRREARMVDRKAVEGGIKMAHDNQWESIVAKLENHIAEALDRRAKHQQPQAATPQIINSL